MRRERIEPAFGDDDRDLRVTLEDRALGTERFAAEPKSKRRRASSRIEPSLGTSKRARAIPDAEPDIDFDEEPMAARTSNRRRARPRDDDDDEPAPRRRSRRRKPRPGLGSLLSRIAYWSLVLALWGGIAAVGILGYTFATLPQTGAWGIPKRPPNIEIVDASGRTIANRGDTGGEAVRLDELPPYLPGAVIAIEDRRFYHHFGLDPIGLVRAAVTNFTAGSVVQGGSTITQQLAKNLFLEPDRTLERKLQEAVLALWLEWQFSKAEILEMYLNRVYLGAGAYGVDGAAQRYFGKSAREVTLEEAAILAGLLKAPSRYAPTRDPALAVARSKTVLAAMTDEGIITPQDVETALAAPPRIVPDQDDGSENYVADWVMDLLPGYVASLSGDIVVETTIDAAMQRQGEVALRGVLAKEGKAYKVSQGALVALDNEGAVKALIGGANYRSSQFNRAVQARRQPGSAFKPFVYLAAVELGYTPDTVMMDEPVSIGGWQPKNYDGKYLGAVTLQTALAKSLNTVAARLAAEVGSANVTQTARRVGIVSPLHDNASIALGTGEVTPLEITSAYVPFANGGFGVIPFLIDRIRDKDGNILFERQGDGPGRVIEPAAVGTMNRMMQTVLEVGTGQKAVLPGHPAGGKTGTSQDFRDAWFIGYVNGLTTGIWLGNDDNTPTKKATGGSLTAVVFNRFMTEATAAIPVRPLPGTEFIAPVVPLETPVADMDGLPAIGPDGIVMSQPVPPADIPNTGPTEAERSLLDQLFGR